MCEGLLRKAPTEDFMTPGKRHRSLLICLFGVLLLAAIGTAGGDEFDLTRMSIEELMNLEVMSPAKKEQGMFGAGAAISVLTAEDLRRSGVTSIPEALRLLPGVHAGRVNGSKWAISVRGFNDLFANKLLVLVDGRTVYTPIFSGVFWESQEVMLGDVERVEVIRGPGGTLWGANAVNGVINVLTRSAEETQGGVVQVGAGSHERGGGSARFGGKLGDRGYYRLYAKHSEWRETEDAEGRPLEDDWNASRVGGRCEWNLSDRDLLTVQGEVYGGEIGEPLQITTSLESPPFEETFVDQVEMGGGSLLGRWQRRLGEEEDFELQVYYDRMERQGEAIHGLVQTFDFDFQHRFSPGRYQEVVWGAGGRFIADEIVPSVMLRFEPRKRSTHLFSAFLQNEVSLSDGQLKLILGSKFEHSTYTGFEVQPNARFTWRPTGKQTVWGAISRVVRTPSRSEHDQFAIGRVIAEGALAPGSPLTVIAVVGSDDFRSEELLAFDLGYRVQPGEQWGLDLAVYYNLYDNLRTNETGLPVAAEARGLSYLLVPISISNKLHGITYGFEVGGNWQAGERWRLRAAYTYLKMDMELDAGSNDPVATTWDEENPNHQLVVRSAWDVDERLSLDATVRYTDELPILKTDSYVTADARLGWRPIEGVELFLVGRHLLDSPHIEFPRQQPVTLPGVVEREINAGLNWRF